jgi:type III secretion protein T
MTATVQTADALWSVMKPLLTAVPRVALAVTVAPLFPTSLFTTLLRGTLIVSLSLHLYPYMAADLTPVLPPLQWLALVGKEAFIGVLLGVAVGTLIWAFEGVGQVVDFQIGFSNAMIFDPFGGHDGGPISRLMTRLGVIVFVAAGGLQVLVSLLFESFRLWPVSSFYPSIGAPVAAMTGGSLESLMDLIARLALPVVLLLALVDVSFGLINRVVSQLNVFYFTMPLKGALAALMIALYLSYMVDVAIGEIGSLSGWIQHVAPVISKPWPW